MISWSLQTHDVVSSTQKVLTVLAEEGLPEGTVVQALVQTEGRGRHGREWVSEEGNLFFSFLLRDVGETGKVSLAAGIAIAQAIGDQASLKWPNDVLIDGKKCAGILIEVEGDAMMVGIGVNIVSAPEEGVAIGGDKDEMRDAILGRFADLYAQDFEAVKTVWLELAHPIGTQVSVKIGDQVKEGVFQGLDVHGNMLVNDEVITAGDVFLCS